MYWHILSVYVCVGECLIMHSTCHNMLLVLSAARLKFIWTFSVTKVQEIVTETETATKSAIVNLFCCLISDYFKGLSFIFLLLLMWEIHPICIYLTGFIYEDWFILSEVLILTGNGSSPFCPEFNQTNFLESKPCYVWCILNILTYMHEVQRLLLPLTPPQSHSLQHKQAHTRTHTRHKANLFFLQAVLQADGQFHRHVCELLGWINHTVLWGKA